MRTSLAALGLILALPAAGQTPATAQTTAAAKTDPMAVETYATPPKAIADAVLAPWYRNVAPANYSPDMSHYVAFERDGLTPLSALAKPHANLAGLDVDVAANRARSLTTRSAKGLRVVNLRTKKEYAVPLRADARVSDASWSPSGNMVAFLVHLADRTELWVYQVGQAAPKRVTERPLLATAVTDLNWVDGDRIVAVVVPEKRPGTWQSLAVAEGPQVQISDTRRTSLRTYASLLHNPNEQAQLEYFTTGQLALIDARSGRIVPVGKAAMIKSVDPAPTGQFFRVTLMEKPFSYLFPYSSFPEREVIWDASGKELTELRKRGLPTEVAGSEEQDEQARRGGAAGAQAAARPAGRRQVQWRPDGMGLSFLQTEPPRAGQPGRDRVMLWRAPFGQKDQDVVWSSSDTIGNVRYSDDARLLFVDQTVAGKSRLSIVRPWEITKNPVVLRDASPNDDPETLVTRPAKRTGQAVRISGDGKYVYFSGTQYDKDPLTNAPRPYLERADLATGKRERVWQSPADKYEVPAVMDDELSTILISRQSPTQIPNWFVHDVRTKLETPVTNNVDYLPDLTQARRESFQVTRSDGTKFFVKVTLPKEHVAGVRPPAFFWFYPSEYTAQEEYDRGRRTFNKNLFNSISASNKTILTRMGYAVVEPDMPIIGPAERKNDGYVPQLRNGLTAVIDELDRRGLADRTRLGIGGHSYGAFSTAHAMIATPYFKAGIAGDGNYNRMLTPFGFQSETRQLWEGREMYLEMSPLLRAEQLTGALLMYHGLEDQNIGTAPINSERMFTALESLGKPASLYMYPYEDHGQIARETVLDQWARWVAWLDKYVKSAK